jgi:hypothetical protein
MGSDTAMNELIHAPRLRHLARLSWLPGKIHQQRAIGSILTVGQLDRCGLRIARSNLCLEAQLGPRAGKKVPTKTVSDPKVRRRGLLGSTALVGAIVSASLVVGFVPAFAAGGNSGGDAALGGADSTTAKGEDGGSAGPGPGGGAGIGPSVGGFGTGDALEQQPILHSAVGSRVRRQQGLSRRAASLREVSHDGGEADGF